MLYTHKIYGKFDIPQCSWEHVTDLEDTVEEDSQRFNKMAERAPGRPARSKGVDQWTSCKSKQGRGCSKAPSSACSWCVWEKAGGWGQLTRGKAAGDSIKEKRGQGRGGQRSRQQGFGKILSAMWLLHGTIWKTSEMFWMKRQDAVIRVYFATFGCSDVTDGVKQEARVATGNRGVLQWFSQVSDGLDSMAAGILVVKVTAFTEVLGGGREKEVDSKGFWLLEKGNCCGLTSWSLVHTRACWMLGAWLLACRISRRG